MRDIRDPANSKAIGERSLEVVDTGVREFTEKWSYTSKWIEIDHMVVTDRYIFIAHALHFCHVIPISAFSSVAHRHDFVNLVQPNISRSDLKEGNKGKEAGQK